MVIKMSFWSIFSSFLSFWSDFHVLIKFTHLSQSDRSAWLSNHHFCRFFVFLSFLSDFHHFGKNHENVIIFHSEVYAHSTLFAGLSQMSHFSHFCHFGENSSKNSHFWHFDLVQIAPLLKGLKSCFGGHLSCHWHRRCAHCHQPGMIDFWTLFHHDDYSIRSILVSEMGRKPSFFTGL